MEINDKSGITTYLASASRYESMPFRRCGNSGIMLPAISLGLWHNFGYGDDLNVSRKVLRTAFDLGITHFDLANNYGPPFGSAEENFGVFLKKDFASYRDELIISSKAGYDMWEGPYGNFGSKKYLVASLDQSLKRMGLDYVDIFYHHRPDPNTPLEETMGALDLMVRQGKALYVGISNYSASESAEAFKILKDLGTPCLIHQMKYSMFEREPEDGLFETLEDNGVGGIAFSPLAQGMLTNKYVGGIPEGSRAARDLTYLSKEDVNEKSKQIIALNEVAKSRGQQLSQMALSWILTRPQVTSVLIGASSTNQLKENMKSLDNTDFDISEIDKINKILK